MLGQNDFSLLYAPKVAQFNLADTHHVPLIQSSWTFFQLTQTTRDDVSAIASQAMSQNIQQLAFFEHARPFAQLSRGRADWSDSACPIQ
jgi:hypothetical protein